MNLKKLLQFILARLALKKLIGAIAGGSKKLSAWLAGKMTTQKLLYGIAGGVLVLMAILAIVVAVNQPPEPVVQADAPITGLVGVSLSGPAGSALSNQMTQELEARGFSVNLLCADGNVSTQKGQLQALLGAKVSCLIVEPVDSLSLLESLAAAKEKGIPVIACDAMLMDTDWVWGCITFDYFTLGKLMARKIVETKNLDAEDAKACKMELFMGAPENQSSLLLYQGAMEVFTPYLRSGKLTVPSGRTLFEDTYTSGTATSAQESCALRLKSAKPDIIFAGSDAIANGCRNVLLAKGYTLENWPVLIGQGGANAQAVKEGYQLATYAKAPIVLAESCADAVQLALSGQTLPDTATQNNRVFDVPVKLLPTSLVDS